MPHRPKPTSNGGATRSSNGGNRVAKTVRTGGDRDPTGNNSRHLFEENIPLTTPKNSSHNSSNHNSNSSAYVSLHHDPKALDGELIWKQTRQFETVSTINTRIVYGWVEGAR